MPYSSESGKSYIRNIIGRTKRDRILDVGCGSGTYAKMFPESKATGVEVWEPYIDKFGLRDIYADLLVKNALEVDYCSLGQFDVAFLGDVLEHMTESDAETLFEMVKSVSEVVVMSIPLGHYPQDEWEGNPYERHVTDDWSHEKVVSVFGEPSFYYQENEIGVYFWSDRKLRPRICVYTISKNEEKFVKRWADSAKDADLLLIADTGSADRTVEIAKECGIQTHEICITPWRFDHARNASIALIPKDIDICICMDVDEVLEPGWREEIERVWTPQTTRLRYMFDWGCGIKFAYEKIHARQGYFWHHPCHEYPVFDKRINEVYAYTNKLLVSHHPDPTKSRGQYLDLLALSVKEDPACPRNAFYYARELSFYAKWDEAIQELKRYLALPGATWVKERSYAMRTMAKCYEGKGDWTEAEAWWLRSAAEAPNTREPWCGLATMYYMQSRWQDCFGAAMRALSITDRELVYTVDPAVWGHQPHDLAAIAAWNLGMKDVAAEQGQIAVQLSPDDERLKENLLWFRGKKGLENAGLSDPVQSSGGDAGSSGRMAA
jgi:SAM-dependent methyltransferase